MKYILCSIALVLSIGANAAAKVNYLNVEGDIVVFTTDEAKSVASPSCVATETAQQWSVSLISPSGRTLYSLLATSLAGGLNVTVASAQDCSDIAGVERALSITVEPIETASAPSTPTASGSGLYLYKGDGTTKIGVVISAHTNVVGVYYVAANKPQKIQFYKADVREIEVYFTENDCQGTAYFSYPNFAVYLENFHGGKFVKTGGSYENIQTSSYFDRTGQCENVSPNYSNKYLVDTSYTDPLCGEHACMIKQG